MRRSRLRRAPLLLLLLCTTLFAGDPLQHSRPVVDRLVDAINAQDFSRIQQDFSKTVLDAFPLSRSQPFFEGILSKYGRIKQVHSPRLAPPAQAIYPLTLEKGVLELVIELDQQGKIIALGFIPPKPTIPVPEKLSTVLHLPFKGPWFTLWGGDTAELNRHRGVSSQQYAFDFLKVGETGRTHGGEGKRNEDFFAFGAEVLAPADGLVTDVIEGVVDNAPGSMNPYSGLGNAVFIRHQEYEVSILAHFKLGSIRVKVGERVKQGQVLGLCGNSGNSSEPHIHYHLQNTPVIQDGTGLKCTFSDVLVSRGGETRKEKSYSPIKNDLVSNAASGF